MTDQPELLLLLRGNTDRNIPGPGSRCSCAELSWGGPGWSMFCASATARHNFDVIIAADIVYREDGAISLVETFKAMYTASCSDISVPQIFMAYKERGAGPVFFSALEAAGIIYEDAAPQDGAHRILGIRWGPAAQA